VCPMATVQRWTGAETKALRQAMRLSVRSFAAHLGVDARTVNKWEARGSSITLLPDSQALLDTALGRAPEDVKTRFTQTPDSSGQQQHTNQTQPVERGTPSTTILADDVMPAAAGRNSEDMMRRELLRLLSMAGVIVTTSGADDKLNQSNHLSINSGRFGDVVVGEYAMLNEHLWRVFMLSKSKGAVLPLVRNQFEVLISSLDQSRGLPTHQRLCELVSELLQLAGEIFFDANKYSDAAHCYTLAATASNEADAFDLWACAMTRHAFIEMYERRYDKAAPMLELAARLARRGDESLSTRYWVSAVQAQTFAGLGELTACQRALDAAEQVQALSGEVSNGGWLRFDGSRLAEERGACYVQLRRPDLAEAFLGDALRQGLPARRRGSALTDLAMIAVQRGDVSQLVAYADTILEIAEKTGSGYVSRRLQVLQGHLTPLLGNGQIWQVNQRIMAITRRISQN
jgi:transcriptional regulator with XRE-family HTH domain/tetratricopeptide (TPR) repeat protein